MEFTKRELQGIELALHYLDGYGGVNKSETELEEDILNAHKKVMKKLNKVGWK